MHSPLKTWLFISDFLLSKYYKWTTVCYEQILVSWAKFLFVKSRICKGWTVSKARYCSHIEVIFYLFLRITYICFLRIIQVPFFCWKNKYQHDTHSNSTYRIFLQCDLETYEMGLKFVRCSWRKNCSSREYYRIHEQFKLEEKNHRGNILFFFLDKSNFFICLFTVIILCGVEVIIILMLIFLRNRIRIAIALLEEGSRYVSLILI